MSDDPPVVYPLFPVEGGAGIEHVRQSYCPHRTATLVRSSHKVFCKECGVELDAWERLSWIAREWERLTYERDALRDERDRLSMSVVELKREERNAKARKRRRDGPQRKARTYRERMIEMYPMLERSGPT